MPIFFYLFFFFELILKHKKFFHRFVVKTWYIVKSISKDIAHLSKQVLLIVCNSFPSSYCNKLLISRFPELKVAWLIVYNSFPRFYFEKLLISRFSGLKVVFWKLFFELIISLIRHILWRVVNLVKDLELASKFYF